MTPVPPFGAPPIAPQPPEADKESPLQAILRAVNTLLPKDVAKIYYHLLSTTGDINAQHQGWSLLHYCAYFSEGKTALSTWLDPEETVLKEIQGLLALMKSLIAQGANLESQDAFGRTPLYFQSGNHPNLETAFLNCLLDAGANIDPPNDQVSPLHIIASLHNKYVNHLIEHGANVYALDKFRRTPLHCAVIHDKSSEAYNVKTLLEFAPLTTEFQDSFGHYPLSYAVALQDDRLVQILIPHTPSWVIQAVSAQIEQEKFPKTDEQRSAFIQENFLDDALYQVPLPFRLIYGGGRSKKSKGWQAIKKQLAELPEERAAEETYTVGATTYSLRSHETHGHKHVTHSSLYFTKGREGLIEKTKTSAATFYPLFAKKYPTLLRESIKAWADRGADINDSFVEFPTPIGADEGQETCFVELYYDPAVGSHIRPKHRS